MGGRDETCKEYKAAVKVSGYVKNPVNDAAALETAIATKGPMSVTVAAEPWQLYGGGIFKGCSSGLVHDNTPQDGVACKPFPKKQIVGGECGVLFDTSYPT